MASKHETLCDGDHTNRQACNSALELAQAEARMPVTVTSDAVSGTAVLEAPRSEETATMPAAGANAHVELARNRVDVDETSAPHAERGEMPAPSPWAVRAWEDTAAAVGATATPAPPPKTPTKDDERDSRPQLLAGHLPLVAGLGAVAALAILVVRRRRT